jgi:hypothetical protein
LINLFLIKLLLYFIFIFFALNCNLQNSNKSHHLLVEKVVDCLIVMLIISDFVSSVTSDVKQFFTVELQYQDALTSPTSRGSELEAQLSRRSDIRDLLLQIARDVGLFTDQFAVSQGCRAQRIAQVHCDRDRLICPLWLAQGHLQFRLDQ